jgi:hypothetical protein
MFDFDCDGDEEDLMDVDGDTIMLLVIWGKVIFFSVIFIKRVALLYWFKGELEGVMEKVQLTDAEYDEFTAIVAGFYGRTVIVGRKRKISEVD